MLTGSHLPVKTGDNIIFCKEYTVSVYHIYVWQQSIRQAGVNDTKSFVGSLSWIEIDYLEEIGIGIGNWGELEATVQIHGMGV